MRNKRVTVRCPASCGELIQGIIKGREMLVSYPVNLYSTAAVELKSGGRGMAGHTKVKKALELLLEKYPVAVNKEDIDIKLDSHIPVGKGMASSTADIAAVLLAAAAALGIPVTEDEIASMAVAVEPTDSTVFRQLTLFDHLKGEYREALGNLPSFSILVVEGKGRINTLNFRKDPGYISKIASRDKGLEKLLSGIRNSDLQSIGNAASESSVLNQQLLCKPYLEELMELSHKRGAAGVNIAHSGTVCGVICSDAVDMEHLQYDIERKLGSNFVGFHKLKTVKGGPEII